MPAASSTTSRGRGPRRALAMVTLVAAAVSIVLVVVGTHQQWFVRERPLRKLVSEVAGCDKTSVERSIDGQRRWEHTDSEIKVSCNDFPTDANPFVERDRFSSATAMRRDVDRRPPAVPVCIASTDVYLAFLESPKQFNIACRRVRGDMVDAVTGLPDVPEGPDGGTEASLDRAYNLQERRNARAQGRALRRYWGARTG